MQACTKCSQTFPTPGSPTITTLFRDSLHKATMILQQFARKQAITYFAARSSLVISSKFQCTGFEEALNEW